MAMLIERGSIASATGNNANTTALKRERLRFIDYCDITQNEIYLFSMGQMDFKWNARCYDAEKTYITTSIYWETGEKVSESTHIPSNTRYVRIVFSHTNTSDDVLDEEIPVVNANIAIIPISNGSTTEIKTNPIYVYPHDCEDFTTTGLVGDLKPLEAVFTEEKNGICQVTIKMPYDKYKRWKALAKGNIIKCPVPVRVPPVIDNDEYANTTEIAGNT